MKFGGKRIEKQMSRGKNDEEIERYAGGKEGATKKKREKEAN